MMALIFLRFVHRNRAMYDGDVHNISMMKFIKYGSSMFMIDRNYLCY